MKTAAHFLLVLGVAFLFTSCGNTASVSPDPNAPPPLRVGVSGDSAPLIWEAGRGNWTGVEADLARALGREIGREVKFVRMGFENLLPAVQKGNVDIVMNGLTVIAQRETLVDFATPYLRSGQGIMVPTKSGTLFQDPRIIFMVPYRIGVKRGTVGNLVAQKVRSDSTIVPYPSAQKAANALKNGKVDLVLHDLPVLWYIAAQNPTAGYQVVPRRLSGEDLAWAVRRGNTSLLNQANQALAKWRKDGTLDRILRTYMPRYEILKEL
jgi:polar amino acid transport system substrate-binding protein